jgi:hypothetical protein
MAAKTRLVDPYPIADGRTRDLAMFNLPIDSKLRGCDIVALRVEDVAPTAGVRSIAPQCGRKRPVGP